MRTPWKKSPSQKGLFATYGRSSKKPTVGRIDDLPCIGTPTYRRFFFGRIEGCFFPARKTSSEIHSGEGEIASLVELQIAGRFLKYLIKSEQDRWLVSQRI